MHRQIPGVPQDQNDGALDNEINGNEDNSSWWDEVVEDIEDWLDEVEECVEDGIEAMSHEANWY